MNLRRETYQKHQEYSVGGAQREFQEDRPNFCIYNSYKFVYMFLKFKNVLKMFGGGVFTQFPLVGCL